MRPKKEIVEAWPLLTFETSLTHETNSMPEVLLGLGGEFGLALKGIALVSCSFARMALLR
jgi:hypothetical protein